MVERVLIYPAMILKAGDRSLRLAHFKGSLINGLDGFCEELFGVVMVIGVSIVSH